jgi:putative DNA primase/helicase
VSPKIGADDHIASGGTIENLPRAEPPAPHCTDLGNSERFVRQHGPDLRYVYQWRAFMHWTGRLWERDRGDGVRERAKETARSIYAEAAAVRDDVQRHALARWAVTSESAHAQQNMVLMAQSAIALPAERFDTHPWLLNLENGTLDLSTGELRPHRRDDLLTKMCPTPYDPRARAERFQAFVDMIFMGDTALIGWVKKLLGTALVGQVPGRVLPIFWGAGANGKTTLVKTVMKVLGDGYAQQAAMSTFLKRRADGPTNDRARLHGARFVAASESGAGRQLDEEFVKLVTGGDPITVRRLYEESFTFEPTFTVVLSTNHRPDIRGTEHAIWSRVHLVPFTYTIPTAEQQRDFLEEVLLPEAAGILAWLVAGCRQWQHEGLGDVPGQVTEATEEYRRESDVLAEFLEDCCDVQRGAADLFEPTSALFEAYLEHCERMKNKHPLGKTEFGRLLGERGLVAGKPHGARGWYGVRLRA